MHVFPIMWQRWWSYHSICHSQKPHAAPIIHGSSAIEPELLLLTVLHCSNRDFRAFCCCYLDLMTFIWLILWRYPIRPQMCFQCQGIRYLPYNKSYIHTDIHSHQKHYHYYRAALQMVFTMPLCRWYLPCHSVGGNNVILLRYIH